MLLSHSLTLEDFSITTTGCIKCNCVTYHSTITLLIFIYLFWVLRCFQHCTGHIMMVSWEGRGNQYIQLVKVLYCKLQTNGKQLPAFPLEVRPGTERQSQRWEGRVVPLYNRGPNSDYLKSCEHQPRHISQL